MRYGTVVVVLALALAACAGGSKAPQAPAPAAGETGNGAAAMADDPKRQIEELADRIATARTQLLLDEPADAALTGVPAQPMGAQPHDTDPKCRPAPSDTCKTSCTLSDSICDNADKICRIAQDLVGDAWAQNQCAKANKTCESSRGKCCGCA